MLMWMAELCIVALALLPEATMAFCPRGCDCDSVPNFINCHNAGLSTVPWNLPDPIGLKFLDMSANNLKEMLSEIVSYRNLEAIDLSDCRIEKINYGVFRSLPNLKKLNLANNKIKLTKGIFAGLQNLEELDLSGNDISEVEEDTFADLKKLKVLNLSRNRIVLYPDVFVALDRLESLSLASNQLYALPSQAFQHVPNLITLNMAGNNLNRLEKDSLSSLTVLRTLDLSENRIELLDDELFLSVQQSLEYLTLSNNSLDRFPIEALNSARFLVHLDVSSNPFTVLDPDSLKGHEQLRELFLHSLPQLKVVRSYALSELTNLEKLYMHSNAHLESIEKDAFLGSSKLKHLDFHSNSLQTLPEDIVPWSQLEYLDLEGNPWRCDCNIKQFRNLVDLVNNETFLCASPPELASLPILSINTKSLTCDVHMEKLQNQKFQDSIMIAIIAGISGILLIVLCVLMMQSRHTFFGTSYQMQVQYHEYSVPPGSRSNGVSNGALPTSSASRTRRSSGRRLYRPGQVQRQAPAPQKKSSRPLPLYFARPPPPYRAKAPSTARHNPSLACIEEELAFAESEERLSEISGDNLV